MRPEPGSSLRVVRQRIALWVAPWLFVPYPQAREDALRELALVAYGSREAVWTSPGVLVKSALREARRGSAALADLEALRSHALDAVENGNLAPLRAYLEADRG